MLNKAEAVAKMNVEDWRDTAAHRRGDIELRSPGYSRTEKNAEEELGSTIISKLPVEAQQHAQKMAEAKGGAMELHVALAKTFLMIMVTTSDERDAVVDELKKKQNVPAKKVLQFMKQYKLDYDRVVLCGFVQETEDHNKFFKAVQHAALNPERAASFVLADVLYKRDNPVPSIFMPKKYFDDYLSFITKELYGHPEYGENHGDSAGAAGAADRDHTPGAVCTHPTCKHRKGHETWQCLTRRREQSERDKKLAQAAKATIQEAEPNSAQRVQEAEPNSARPPEFNSQKAERDIQKGKRKGRAVHDHPPNRSGPSLAVPS